jgi:hypothetical protein
MFLALVATLLPGRPNVPGIRWSRYAYATITGMTDLNECASLCLMAGNVTCHYYLLVSGTCYLGNILTNKSLISSRTETQNIYIAAGLYMENILIKLSM